MPVAGDGGLMEPGAQVMLQRGDLVLASIVDHPQVAAYAADHRRTGVNVASLALAALRGEGVRGRAMQALLRAVGDAPCEPDEGRDIRFLLPDAAGEERWLRLDEIPLPPTTPAAWPRP